MTIFSANIFLVVTLLAMFLSLSGNILSNMHRVGLTEFVGHSGIKSYWDCRKHWDSLVSPGLFCVTLVSRGTFLCHSCVPGTLLCHSCVPWTLLCSRDTLASNRHSCVPGTLLCPRDTRPMDTRPRDTCQ